MKEIRVPCFLKRFENFGKMQVYTCDQVRKLEKEWKETFRKINKVDEIEEPVGKKRIVRKDPAYEAFCEEIDDFLKRCKCTQ